MRKQSFNVVLLALFATLVFPTIIITEAKPQFLDIGGGSTMVVVNGDIEEDRLDGTTDSAPQRSPQPQ